MLGSRPPYALTIFLAVALLALESPARSAGARPDAAGATPTELHVIAEGAGVIPAGQHELVWRVDRGAVSGDRRTETAVFPLGFALAGRGPLALLAADGRPIAELTAGRAAFLPAGEVGAFASASGDLALYVQIALVAAADSPRAPPHDSRTSAPFPAPRSERAHLELARGLLAAGSAIELAGKDPPALLLAGERALEIELAAGALDLASGEIALLTGAATIRNPGPQPSTFIVASVVPSGAAASTAKSNAVTRLDRDPALDDAWERYGCHLNPGNPACQTVARAVACASDPAATGCTTDSDGDGCHDIAEVRTGFDPFAPADCVAAGGEPALNCLFPARDLMCDARRAGGG